MPTLTPSSRMRTNYCLIAVFLLLGSTMTTNRAWAQSESASVSGRVTDQSGAALPGVEIEIKNTDTNVTQEAKTNGEGFYVIPSIRPGNYLMNVRKQSFRTTSVTGITLNVQDNLSRNFTLQVGASAESVTVRGDGVNVNTTDGTVSTVIDRKFVENIPLNGRSLQDLLTLAPGAALVGNIGSGGNTAAGYGGEISVNGQRTEANYFTVDGVSANVGTNPSDLGGGAGFAGATPASTAVGTTQSIVSLDALQEFRAQTSSYSAEYGRTPGGQFGFTTRSGTNEWHGSAYDYFRNEALDANNWFLDQLGQAKVKERQNDFGGTLGGPILIPGLYDGKDKTFFFFSYEGLRLWTPQGLQTSFVPDAALRSSSPTALQPILNSFPLPNAGEDGFGDGFAYYKIGVSNPSAIDNIGIRIDHNLNSRLKIFGRYANTPTVSTVYSSSQKADSNINAQTLTVGATTAVSARQTNELRFNITQTASGQNKVTIPVNGSSPIDLSSLPGPNGGSFPQFGSELFVGLFLPNNVRAVTSSGTAKNSQRQYNLVDTHNLIMGRHSLKFGIDWRRLSTYAQPYTAEEDFDYFSSSSISSNSADFSDISATPIIEPIYNNFSSFVEDEWKFNSRLSLALGLRWDINPAPTNARGPSPYTLDQVADLATAKLAPAGTPLWQTDWRAFAPRFGAAYQLSRKTGRELVVRGGIGEFYDLGSSKGSNGFNGIGISAIEYFATSSFPFSSAQLDSLPPSSVAAPYGNFIYAFDPHLRLPYTLEWTFALEQSLGSNNSLTATYLGSAGRKLLTTHQYAPENLGNPNFDPNVCSACLFVTTNASSSDYNALQAQYERRLSRGLQALASYTWSHSIDTASNNFILATLARGNSDFDIRHNVQVAVTYDVPGDYKNRILSRVLTHWGFDTRVSAHSATPVDVVGSVTEDPVSHTELSYDANIVPGQPLVLYGSQYPGGRILNANAYEAAPNGVEGNAGRNSARGFGTWQANLALRREFPITERLRLHFRAEAFNIFNHPNFGDVVNYVGSGACPTRAPAQGFNCFGVATATQNQSLGGLSALYQSGGPRSLQIALKLSF